MSHDIQNNVIILRISLLYVVYRYPSHHVRSIHVSLALPAVSRPRLGGRTTRRRRTGTVRTGGN